jgi:hypothetical protein
MPGGLREPVKPRREQSAADKYHDQINDQRPEWSHDATIRFRPIQAKREFGSRTFRFSVGRACLRAGHAAPEFRGCGSSAASPHQTATAANFWLDRASSGRTGDDIALKWMAER